MSSSEESETNRMIAVRCDSTDEDDFICIIDEQVPTTSPKNDTNQQSTVPNEVNQSQSSDESDEGIAQSSSSSIDGEQHSSTSSTCSVPTFKKFKGIGKLEEYPNLQKWIYGIAVVNFDIEIGQSIECIFPGDVQLTEREVCFLFSQTFECFIDYSFFSVQASNICYLSFPDSNS